MNVPLSKYSRVSLIFLTLSVLYGFSDQIIGANYVLFLKERGLDFSQIGVVMGAFFLVNVLLEIPTGNLADRFGRAKNAMTGYLLLGSGLVVYGLSRSFTMFLAAQIIGAVGTSLHSGAFEAWYIDALKKESREEESRGIFSMTMGTRYLVGIVSGGIAAALIAIRTNLPFLVAGAIGILVGIVGFLIIEDNYGSGTLTYSEFFKKTFSVFKSDRSIQLFTLGMFFVQVCFTLFILTWQIHLTDLGLQDSYLGLVYATFMAVLAVTSFSSATLMNRAGVETTALVAAGFFIVTFVVLSFTQMLFLVFVGFVLFEAGMGLQGPAIFMWRNQLIPSELRASLISGMFTVVALSTSICTFAFGKLIAFVGIQGIYYIAVIFAVLAVLAFSVCKQNQQV